MAFMNRISDLRVASGFHWQRRNGVRVDQYMVYLEDFTIRVVYSVGISGSASIPRFDFLHDNVILYSRPLGTWEVVLRGVFE
jgi:hypothetical protein